MEPLISVIVPVYKAEQYLCECVDSIINQTYKNLEIILVDDGSPDNCGELCDQYARIDSRVVVIHKKNEGVSVARNVGLRYSKGKYVSFIDSDDWIDKEYFNNFMKLYSFDIAYCGCTLWNKDSESKISVSKEGVYRKDKMDFSIIRGLVEKSLFGYSAAKIYKREVLFNVKYLETPLREDLIFNLVAFDNAQNIGIIDNCGYYYRQHDESILHKKFSKKVPDTNVVTDYMILLAPGESKKEKRNISNIFIKVCLLDVAIKFIMKNESLTPIEKRKELERVFRNTKVRRILRIYKNDCYMYMFFTLCYKLNLPRLFYFIVKRLV